MKDSKKEITSIITSGLTLNTLGTVSLVIGVTHDKNPISMSLGVLMIIAGAVLQGVAIGKSRKLKK